MLALSIISLLLFTLVVLDLILKHKRGYGLYGKYFDEEYHRVETLIGYSGIIALFLFTCWLILFHEPAREQLLDALRRLIE